MPRLFALLGILACTSCGGSPIQPSTELTTQPRASLTVTVRDVTTRRVGSTTEYSLIVGFQETGGIEADVTSITMNFAHVGTVTFQRPLPFAIPANGIGSTGRLTVFNSNISRRSATSVEVIVSYSDALGSRAAVVSAAVPPL